MISARTEEVIGFYIYYNNHMVQGTSNSVLQGIDSSHLQYNNCIHDYDKKRYDSTEAILKDTSYCLIQYYSEGIISEHFDEIKYNKVPANVINDRRKIQMIPSWGELKYWKVIDLLNDRSLRYLLQFSSVSI